LERQGNTAIHDDRGINYFHVNPQIVGTDLHDLSTKLPAFWKILEASLKGPASGYYDWKDADGKIRPKYMYLSPVKDTDLIVAATTYIDEFSLWNKSLPAGSISTYYNSGTYHVSGTNLKLGFHLDTNPL
jgi:hypothetical protein